MKRIILRLVNGFEDEWSQIAALLLLGFFGSVFIATFSVGTETIFLNTFSAKEYIPRAFIASGVLGIVTTFLFGKLQKWVRYKLLTYATYFFITTVVLVLSFTLHYSQHEGLVFFAYVVQTPLTALITLLFWLSFGRLFDIRQVKRLASGIDTGSSFATIAAFFAIPFIQSFLRKTSDMMLIAGIALIGASVTIVYMNRRFQFSESIKISQKVQSIAKGNPYKGRYVALMSWFVVCSMLAAGFVEYSFLHTVESKFTEQEKDLASFLSFFNGTVMIVSFLIQTFLNDRIVEMFGTRNSLLLLPSLLLFFTTLTVLCGHLFGYSPTSELFLIFFVVVSVSKLFTDALRDSLENPIFKMFFFPLPIYSRFEIQTFVEGTIKESANLLGGVVLLGLGSLPFLELLHIHYVIFLIIAFWVIVILKLYRYYYYKLIQTLRESHSIHSLQSNNLKTESEWTHKAFRLRFTLEVNPFNVANVYSHLDSEDVPSKRAAFHVIKSLHLFQAVSHLKKFMLTSQIPEVIQSEALQLIEYFQSYQPHNAAELTSWLYSKKNSEKRVAIFLLSYESFAPTHPVLSSFLREADSELRRAAIFTAGKLRLLENLPLLLSNFSLPEYAPWATASVIQYGEDALPILDEWFYKTGQSTDNLLRIIYVFSRISSPRSVQYLVKKFNHPEKKIRLAVLRSLQKQGWKADKSFFPFFKTFIEEAIETLLWNELALYEIPKHEIYQTLLSALEEEIAQKKEEIFLYLSLIYDKNSVNLVAHHIRLGTSESIGYALELLDIFLDDNLKPILLPILEDISPTEKLSKLETYFSRDRYTSSQVLMQIVHRDANQISTWTKACAVILLPLSANNLQQVLCALLFHPQKILRQTASLRLQQLNINAFKDILKRLPPSISDELRTETSLKNIYERFLILQKVSFFSKHFPMEPLLEVAEKATIQIVEKRQVVWDGKVSEMPIFLVIEGTLHLLQAPKTLVKEFLVGDIVNDIFQYDLDFQFKRIVASQASTILSIERFHFFDIMIRWNILPEEILISHPMAQTIFMVA
ncbi:MAG: hypothetical protein NZM38_08500 [Cytophagales bacterium]|nr:hypothetical protein [Cytophagales bacterium]MDW8384798.1 hypothetical protein [Flammeovirgaceae bacterium]